MKRDKSYLTGVLQEQVNYGGTLATRQEVIEDLLSLRGRNGEKMSHLHCERLAFMCPAIQPGHPVPRMTLKRLRAIEAR